MTLLFFASDITTTSATQQLTADSCLVCRRQVLSTDPDPERRYCCGAQMERHFLTPYTEVPG